MKKITIAMLAMGIMATSCQKDDDHEVKSSVPMTIHAFCQELKSATRAAVVDRYDIVWSANDKLFVMDGVTGVSNDTFTLISGEGTNTGTFKQDGTATFTRRVKAYYPSTLMQNGKLVWPATQTENQAIPMYCTKDYFSNMEDLTFNSLCSVLQVVFNTKQENVVLKSIEIKDGSKTMSGEFEVAPSGRAIIKATDHAGITLDLGTSGVALGTGANFFHLFVPAGDYEDLTFTFTAMDGTQCVVSGCKACIENNTFNRISITGSQFRPAVPVGALPGKFSVSNDDGKHVTQVFFAQGNLYYDGKLFKFEEKQEQYKNVWYINHVSHFYWSTSPYVAYATGYNDERANRSDQLFTNATETTSRETFSVDVDGKPQYGWRALSLAEWVYLLEKRTVNGGKGKDRSFSTNVYYNGIRGFVIYPDDYTGKPIEGQVSELPEGVVFCPATGVRYSSWVGNPRDNHQYWTSTVTDEKFANAVEAIKDATLSWDEPQDRYQGSSLRLVIE